jgi:DNA-binding NarL/FixJ family response regulator
MFARDCSVMAIAVMTIQNAQKLTDDQASEYFGDGWQIVGHTCSRYFGPEWRAEQSDDKGIILPRGLYGKNGRLEQIMKMIAQGLGTRKICRDAHATGRTVRKCRDILQKLTG